MTRFPARSSYTYALLTVSLLIVVGDCFWANFVLARLNSVPFALDVPAAPTYLFQIVILGLGGFVSMGLAFTELVDESVAWWKVTVAAAFFAGFVNLADSLTYYGERGFLILDQDLVSVTISAILITVIVAWLSRRLSPEDRDRKLSRRRRRGARGGQPSG